MEGGIIRVRQRLSYVKRESKYHRATIAPKYQWEVIFGFILWKLGKILFNCANNKIESNWIRVMQRGINIHAHSECSSKRQYRHVDWASERNVSHFISTDSMGESATTHDYGSSQFPFC